MKRLLVLLFIPVLLSGCSVGVTMSGTDTSGASTFSVDYFKPNTALATPLLAQRFTESLKDLILQQSPLNLTKRDGDLTYEGSIIGYDISPSAVQANETADQNRLTITVKVKYTNTIEKEKSFERTFSKFADYPSSQDLFAIEDQLIEDINDQLTQDIFNASLGNW
jgi:hypothetical protein